VTDVSVIVVNFRSAALSARALTAARAAAGGLAVELVVVDNTPEGEGEALAAAVPGATVIPRPDNPGFAGGVNAGMARARGRHVLLLNPDAFPEGDAVARLVAYLDAHPRVGVVAPLLRHEDGSVQNNAYKRAPTLLTLFVEYALPLQVLLHGTRLHPHNLPDAALARPRRIAHATGAALLVRREAAQAAGPLDEGYFLYLEETEWQGRIAAAGWEVHLEPGARVTHLGGGSGAGLAFASPHYVASVRRYFGGRRATPWVMGTAALLSLAATSVAARLRPGDPRLAEHARAYRRVLALLRGT